jgi:prenyltransferase beta subunit
MKRHRGILLLVLCCPAAGFGQSAQEQGPTLAYLRVLQTQSGGFLPSAPSSAKDQAPVPSLRATTAALRALKYFGGQAPDRDLAVRFVKASFDPATGGFADRPGAQPDVPTTAVGLMALVELGVPLAPYRDRAIAYMAGKAQSFEEIRMAAAGVEAAGVRPPQADAWLAAIANMRNADGTYGKGDGTARATGSAVVAVLRLGGKVEDRQTILRTLRGGQRTDGGFGKEGEKTSDLESSYRIMRAFHMLREQPDADALRGFLRRCRNADGGYGVMPGQPSSVGATYYAAIILHWLAER